jgi:hypothetical protein
MRAFEKAVLPLSKNQYKNDLWAENCGHKYDV